ncbi:MAG TPA: chemotaxis response regulator protein-glutamate methylesterase [Gammaproteobacteria bacterium]|nr:chemotaxis response regulator protein-glutamate methylesterase [Gammaproteobacteria bacterium]
MVTRVLVVDDSGFFRRRIVEILEVDPTLKVVGTAANGQEAVQQVPVLKPDVVTMDIEMPVMDGISAVREIMRSHPVPVLMFSSLTHEGARATLDALEAGAVDFLPKRFEDIARDRDEATRLLRARIHAVAGQSMGRVSSAPAVTAKAAAGTVRPVSDGRPARLPRSGAAAQKGRYRLAVIASSTGGPVALNQVLTRLPADFRLPVLVVQHMPGSFTGPFAQRLDQQCRVSVREAADGDELVPGRVLIAPGGMQLTLSGDAARVHVKIDAGDPALHYKPCADLTFESAARAFGGKVLALVLTGMGADGREGARRLKQCGATVWSQDEATSVIYGMPAAVAEAGLSDQVLPLHEIGPALADLGG